MPTPGDGTEPSVTGPSVAGTPNHGDWPVINEVFDVQSHLEVKLDDKSTDRLSQNRSGQAGYSDEVQRQGIDP